MNAPTLIKIALGFVILSAVFFVIERFLGRGRGRPLFRKGWGVDTCFWFFTPLVTKWLTRLSLIVPLGIFIWFGGTTVEAFKSGAYHGYGPLSRQPIWLQILPVDRLPQNFGIPEAFATNFVGQLLKPFTNWAGK